MSCFSPELRRALRSAIQRQPRVELFVRDDDVDMREDSLEKLLEICREAGTPITLAVVPGLLTKEGRAFLLDKERDCVELHQHGWNHTNHEWTGRKSEFGSSRSFDQQIADLQAGKKVMDDAFEDRWYPAFTPPWNRCTQDTVRALEELQFSVLSTDCSSHSTYALQPVPISLDIFHWKGGAALRPPEQILGNLIDQISRGQRIGILLHHKVMDGTAFDFLNLLLNELASHLHVHFGTLRTFASGAREQLPVATRLG